MLTTLYFTVMQPIGLFVWIYQAQFKKEEQEFVARKLDAVGWTKYLSISAIWWLVFGYIYQSVGAIVRIGIPLRMQQMGLANS